jgi:hypothetical protein
MKSLKFISTLFFVAIILSSCFKAKPIPNPSISLIVGTWQLYSTVTTIEYYDTTITKDTGYSVNYPATKTLTMEYDANNNFKSVDLRTTPIVSIAGLYYVDNASILSVKNADSTNYESEGLITFYFDNYYYNTSDTSLSTTSYKKRIMNSFRRQ